MQLLFRNVLRRKKPAYAPSDLAPVIYIGYAVIPNVPTFTEQGFEAADSIIKSGALHPG